MSNVLTIKDFFEFAKTPDFKSYNMSFGAKVIQVLKFYFLTIIILIPWSFINNLLINLNIYLPYDSLTFQIAIHARNNNLNYYWFIFIICFAAILEEFTFRLFITKYRMKYFIISTSLILSSFIIILMKNVISPHSSEMFLMILIGYSYTLLIALIIIVLLFGILKQKSIQIIMKQWNNHPRKIVYSSALVFSLIHLPNYDLSTTHYLFLPLILFPLIVYAVILSYIRIRIGIVSAIFLHFCYLAPMLLKRFTL